MQKENNLTVGQWCSQWFNSNRSKWNGNTEGGYRNLIYSHILPGIGSIELTDLTEQTVTDFYDPEVSGAFICSCGGAWTKRRGISSSHSTRCGSARSRRQRNTSLPLCAWDKFSVTSTQRNSSAYFPSSIQDYQAVCGNVN